MLSLHTHFKCLLKQTPAHLHLDHIPSAAFNKCIPQKPPFASLENCCSGADREVSLVPQQYLGYRPSLQQSLLITGHVTVATARSSTSHLCWQRCHRFFPQQRAAPSKALHMAMHMYTVLHLSPLKNQYEGGGTFFHTPVNVNPPTATVALLETVSKVPCQKTSINLYK